MIPGDQIAHPQRSLVAQTLCGGDRRRAVGVRQHDAELLAAEPDRHIAVARELAQQVAEPSQDAVADVVPVAIVDLLEVIQIADQQCDVRVLGQQTGEATAVAHAGQGVMRGEVTQLPAMLDRVLQGGRVIDQQADGAAVIVARQQPVESDLRSRPGR